jgi:hypothetical protein
MRIFITKTDTDLTALGTTLLRKPADAGAALENVRALNPHVEDFQDLPAGTVLLLPDTPSIKASAGTTVGTDNVDDLAADVGSGMKAIESRVTSREDDLQADHGAVRAALKTAAVKRLVDGDPALAKQLEAAEAEYKRQQKRVEEAKAELAEVQAAARAEFARLQKLLGQ